MFTVIGIDPGRKGAIARIKGTAEEPLKECDLWEFRQPDLAWDDFQCQRLRDICGFWPYGPSMDLISIERPLAIPYDSKKSLVSIGCNFGFIIGLFGQYEHRIELVYPQTWKAAVLGGAKAESLFYRIFDVESRHAYGNCPAILSSADAALIAVYSMGTLLGGKFPRLKKKCPCLFHPWPFTKKGKHSSNGEERNDERDACPAGTRAGGDGRGPTPKARKAPRKREPQGEVQH